MVVVFLAVADPQHFGSEPRVGFRCGCVAVGEDDEAVVFVVCLDVVEDGLEVGAAASRNLDFASCFHFVEAYDGLQLAVELHHIDAFDAVGEEFLDDGEESVEVIAGD